MYYQITNQGTQSFVSLG